MPTTAILGGGLSGLSTAFYLSKALPASHKIIILEKSKRFGGWIQTSKHENGISFEAGPRSIRPVGLQGLLTLDLIDQLGLTSELITVSKKDPAARNRFIYFNGRLNKAPSTIVSAISSSFSRTSPFSGLLSAIFREAFKSRSTLTADESVDSFVKRRFGASFAENVLSALVHGIYAGDTRQLSIQAVFPSLWKLEQRYGSVVKGILQGGIKPSELEITAKQELESRLIEIVKRMMKVSVYSLQDGLEMLPKALIRYLKAQPNVELRNESSLTQLSYDGTEFTLDTSSHNITAEYIVSALSSSVLDPFVQLPHLRYNPSVTVGVVNLAFAKPFKLPIQGFGYLIPRTVLKDQNPHHALGVVFDSDMFDSEGPTKVTVMLGGAYWDSGSFPSREELEKAALETLNLHGVVPADIEPIFVQATLQRDCIPQYLVGHSQRMKEIHEALVKRYDSKLGLVGSSYSGVGLNDCIKSTWDLTSRFVRDGRGTGLEAFAS